MGRAYVDETVEALTVNERFKIGADVDVGRRLARFGVAFDADRMLGACCCHVAEIRLERERLALAAVSGREVDGYKRRVVDGDADLFDGRDEYVAVAVLAKDCGKQLYQFGSANGRAHIKPCAIAGNAHVEITAIWRIPEVNRR